jgi:threonine synthase
MSIWRWADWIDPVPAAARITLGEGNTPLIRSRSIGPSAGLKNLFFKLETVNPSGSYKDRFAAAAITSASKKLTDPRPRHTGRRGAGSN